MNTEGLHGRHLKDANTILIYILHRKIIDNHHAIYSVQIAQIIYLLENLKTVSIEDHVRNKARSWRRMYNRKIRKFRKQKARVRD